MTPERLRAIKDTVDRHFDQQNDGFVINYGMRRLVDGIELIPDLIDFIDADMEAVIENYYGSHFKLFAVTCYRTMPTRTSPTRAFSGTWTIARSRNQADGISGRCRGGNRRAERQGQAVQRRSPQRGFSIVGASISSSDGSTILQARASSRGRPAPACCLKTAAAFTRQLRRRLAIATS